MSLDKPGGEGPIRIAASLTAASASASSPVASMAADPGPSSALGVPNAALSSPSAASATKPRASLTASPDPALLDTSAAASMTTEERRESVRDLVPKASRVALQFPALLEEVLAPLDDWLIPHCQQLWSALPLRVAVLGVTTITAIESALPVPGALYALGYDAAAGLATTVLIVLAFASQIPKKFIFRERPWMSGRAVGFRKDSTSSFPSRAVVCAVVFVWLCLSFVDVEIRTAEKSVSPFSLRLGVFVAAILAAVSRVIVGAHYPSDTYCGFLLGIAVVCLGRRIEASWYSHGCAALTQLHTSGPYVLSQPPIPRTGVLVDETQVVISSLGALFTHAAYGRLALWALFSYILTLASVAGFWVKCSYVYGLLLSMATFRSVFLCPSTSRGIVAPVYDRGGFRKHVVVVLQFFSILAFGMATRGKKGAFRIVSFTIIFFSSLSLVLLWRIP